MSRHLIAAAGAALLLTAGSASAQTPGPVVTGTITLNGSVASKCAVMPGGASGGTFAATVELGELAGADGLLLPGLTTTPTTANTSSFTLKCTGANLGVSVASTALDNTTTTSAPSGYTETVNFLGRATLDVVTGSSTTTAFVEDASGGTATSANLGAATFLANAPNNVKVSAYGFNTATSAVLLAGGYTGQIVVVLTPN